MQRISFAPVLSATLSRDSCWITSTPVRHTGSLASLVEPTGRGGPGGPPQDYLAFSRISTTRQRLVADRGRVSMRRTRSPTPHSLASSWALYLVVRRMILPYNACFTRSSTATTTVLSILSLTTRPSRTLRFPRSCVWSVIVGFLHGLLGDGHDAELPLPHHGVDASDLALHGLQSPVALQLAGGGLETKVEQLFLRLLQLAGQLFLRLGPQLIGGKTLGHQDSPTSRLTILHFIGSL